MFLETSQRRQCSVALDAHANWRSFANSLYSDISMPCLGYQSAWSAAFTIPRQSKRTAFSRVHFGKTHFPEESRPSATLRSLTKTNTFLPAAGPQPRAAKYVQPEPPHRGQVLPEPYRPKCGGFSLRHGRLTAGSNLKRSWFILPALSLNSGFIGPGTGKIDPLAEPAAPFTSLC